MMANKSDEVRTEEPFQVAKLFLDSGIAHVFLINEELDELGEICFVVIIKRQLSIEVLEVILYSIELLDCPPCPLIDCFVLADELSHHIRRARAFSFLFFSLATSSFAVSEMCILLKASFTCSLVGITSASSNFLKMPRISASY